MSTSKPLVTLSNHTATVPAAHVSGSRVWFHHDYAEADLISYSMSTTVQAQLLRNTSSGQLDPALAGTDTIVLQTRQGRPHPPGQFQISGAYYQAVSSVMYT